MVVVMQIRYHCPTDGCVAIVEFEPLEEVGETIRCPRCKVEHRMIVTDAMRRESIVDRCAVCGATEMFVRKDFPQGLGLAIVIVFGLAALYAFRESEFLAWGILGSAMLLDFVIYLVIGKATTCYACRAEYRKCKLNPNHDGFDLATSEKY